MGRLTADPETKEVGSTTLTKFNIAYNHTYTSNNEKKEEVSYFECIAWSKLGEVINEYFTKGSRILLNGRNKQDRWEDKENGKKRSKVVIVVEGFDFIDKKSTGQEPVQDNPFDDKEIPF